MLEFPRSRRGRPTQRASMDWTLAKPDPLHRHRQRAGRSRLSRHVGAGRQRQSATARDDADRDAAESQSMSETARGRRSSPLETPRPSAPSTSRKQKFRASSLVKDGPSGRREAAEVLDKTGRSEKEALQEVDGAVCGWLVEPLTPTQSSWPGLTRPSRRRSCGPRRTLRAAGRAGRQQSLGEEAAGVAAWMAGSSPAMTTVGGAR